jgi:hypothetical protein
MSTASPSRSLFPFLDKWLCCSEAPRPADALFVLAGRRDRKFFALDLFRQNLAPKLLFSVARFEIRRFSKMPLPVPVDLLQIAAPTAPPLRHFFVLFEFDSVHVEYVRPGRFGTLTEIAALARWIRNHSEVRSLLLLSNGIHLRRVRLCCRFLLPAGIRLAFIASPEGSTANSQHGASLWRQTAASLLELAKLLAYWIVLRVRRWSSE